MEGKPTLVRSKQKGEELLFSYRSVGPFVSDVPLLGSFLQEKAAAKKACKAAFEGMGKVRRYTQKDSSE